MTFRQLIGVWYQSGSFCLCSTPTYRARVLDFYMWREEQTHGKSTHAIECVQTQDNVALTHMS